MAASLANFEADRWVVPLPASLTQIKPVTAVRGTFLVAHREGVRRMGLFDSYEKAVPPSVRSLLAQVCATSWVSLDLVNAHCEALDTLQLHETTILGVATATAERVNGIFVSTALKAARTANLTPWSVFAITARMSKRAFLGGEIGVERTGPRNARVTFAGFPFHRYRFPRVGARGHLQRAIQNLSPSAHVREEAYDPAQGLLRLVARWV